MKSFKDHRHIYSSVRTITVVIGTGHSGARDEPAPQRTLDRPRGPRAARHLQRVEDRTVGLAALLSPNWQCRLPGYVYDGTDPDGFMTVPEVADFITAYAEPVAAPVKPGTTVTSASRGDDEYRVTTDQGEWRCDTVVIANWRVHVPDVTLCAEAVPSSVVTFQ